MLKAARVLLQRAPGHLLASEQELERGAVCWGLSWQQEELTLKSSSSCGGRRWKRLAEAEAGLGADCCPGLCLLLKATQGSACNQLKSALGRAGRTHIQEELQFLGSTDPC